jgi:tetratricopeptide (TPR) repeat protein
MPDTARILRFPNRVTRGELCPDDARVIAFGYLSRQGVQIVDEVDEAPLVNPDVLLALCGSLRETTDSTPGTVAEKAEYLYRLVSKPGKEMGLFDERDYFLGELALITGGAARHLGKHEDAGRWLDRAEAAFRHVVNAAPQLAKVSYARLALFFQTRRFDDVLELIPSLLKSFERFGMTTELRKAEFLEAMSLKQCSRDAEALSRFCQLRDRLKSEEDPALLGHVLIEIGGYSAAECREEEALRDYTQAAKLLAAANRPMALAHLKVTIGESLRESGNFGEALLAFRSAVGVYSQLEMVTFAAYTRVFVADVLLRLDRPREAEWEILAALPTIEEQKMVPEGFAAVALLKESVRQRQTDPNALRELREHLRANQN